MLVTTLKPVEPRADERAVRILVAAYVAIVGGGVVVGYGLTKGLDGHHSYGPDSLAGVALGLLLFVVGGWLVLRRARSA